LPVHRSCVFSKSVTGLKSWSACDCPGEMDKVAAAGCGA
jgi:hypothetical protein